MKPCFKKERKKINLLKFFPHLSILDYITYILYGIYPRAFEKCDEIESIICHTSWIMRCMLVQSLLTDNAVVRVILP